jgi:enoyl-CoA hydratase/carnithine racemase
MSPYVVLDINGSVAAITLARPPVNALDAVLVEQFEVALNAIEADAGVSVVTIRSSVKAFCAGADLGAVGSFLQCPSPSQAMAEYARTVQRLLDRIEQLPAVTVCEIQGSAMGGGLELALAADFRLASSRAKFGLPEAALGLIPAAGGTQRLARLCGVEVARRMILTGRVLNADQALASGLVTEVYPEGEHAARVDAFVAALSKQPAAALRAAKRCLAQALPLAQGGFDSEVREIGGLVMQSETQQHLRAFLAKAA